MELKNLAATSQASNGYARAAIGAEAQPAGCKRSSSANLPGAGRTRESGCAESATEGSQANQASLGVHVCSVRPFGSVG